MKNNQLVPVRMEREMKNFQPHANFWLAVLALTWDA